MKNNTILFLLLASFMTIVHADGQFNPHENIPANRVFETMQNEFSKRLKQNYSHMDRTPLFVRCEEILYGPHRVKTSESIYKGHIHNAVDQVLTEMAVEKMRAIARLHNQSTLLSPDDVANKYKEEIERACYNEPTTSLFDKFLNESHMRTTLQTYHDHRQTELIAEEQRDLRQNHNADINRILGNQAPATENYPQPPHSIFQNLVNALYYVLHSSYPAEASPETQPPAHSHETTPSTTTTPHKIFPNPYCIAQCYTNFKQDNVDSFFLPCGHAICPNCFNRWIIPQKSCPQRCQLTTADIKNIAGAINKERRCTLCNEAKNNMTRLVCNHYICHSCKSNWTNQAPETMKIEGETFSCNFAAECPRCHNQFRQA